MQVGDTPRAVVKGERGDHERHDTAPLTARVLRAGCVQTPLLRGSDRAILATFLYHGLRWEELCKLRVRDLQQQEGVLHFRVHGKGDKVRYIPVGLKAQRLITEYLEASKHKEDLDGALFRP